MTRLKMTVVVLAMSVAVTSGQQKPAGDVVPDLTGTWKLNRELSQFPTDVGFGMDLLGAAGERVGGGGGVEDIGGGGMGRPSRPPSQDEARNTQQLVDEVRNPSPRLAILQSVDLVTVSDAGGRSRVFHTDGRQESQPLDASPVATAAGWEGGRLVIRYRVSPGREIRYSYTRKANSPQLTVQTDLVEHGGRMAVVRIYEPARAGEPLTPAEAAAAGRPATSAPPLPTPQTASPSPAGQAAPAALRGAAYQSPILRGVTDRTLVPMSPDRAASGPIDQRPDAELIGLRALGVVVEGLGTSAGPCGLRQDRIEAAVSKSLSAVGLEIVRNTDEDTYLYVNIITAVLPNGGCFSRYDATLYTHTTATLPYGSSPVLAQVSLLHKGGVTGGSAATHGATVVNALTQYVDQFATRIREANK